MRALAFLVMLIPALALAAPDAVKEKHRQAQEQLIAGETEAALALVDEGLRLSPRDPDLLLLRGHVLLKASDYNGALAAYRQYLAAGARGGNKREVLRIVSSLEQASTTFLAIKVANGPAEVRVDTRSGKPFCVANPDCKHGIVPGDHLVVVDRAGHQRLTRRVDVPAGQTLAIDFKLVEKAAPLTLRATPVDASVVVDGAAVPAELAPGQHVIVVTRPGYFAERRTVKAVAGVPVELEIDLVEAMTVTVFPVNATVTVDGKPVQIVDGQAPAGRKLSASAPGYRAASLTVRPGEAVDLVLERLGAQVKLADAPRGAKFYVDGATLPLASLSEVGPGPHTVEVALPGRPRFTRSVNLEPGTVATVHVEAERGGRPKAIISALVGVAGLGAGAYFGTAALDKRKEYDARAADPGVGVNEPTQMALAEDGKRLALLADVSFGVGVVGLVASMVWFRIEGRDVEGRVEIQAAPGAVQVSGRF